MLDVIHHFSPVISYLLTTDYKMSARNLRIFFFFKIDFPSGYFIEPFEMYSVLEKVD